MRSERSQIVKSGLLETNYPRRWGWRRYMAAAAAEARGGCDLQIYLACSTQYPKYSLYATVEILLHHITQPCTSRTSSSSTHTIPPGENPPSYYTFIWYTMHPPNYAQISTYAERSMHTRAGTSINDIPQSTDRSRNA